MTCFVETLLVPSLYDKDFFLFVFRGHFTEYGFLLRGRSFQGSDIRSANKQPGSTVRCIRNLTGGRKGKGRIDSNQITLWNFLMQIIFQYYYIFTKAIQNGLYTFANVCHLSSYMLQFHFTSSSESDSLYMALNYSYKGIYGCSSGSQEYCQFPKANEPTFLSFFPFSVSFFEGIIFVWLVLK